MLDEKVSTLFGSGPLLTAEAAASSDDRTSGQQQEILHVSQPSHDDTSSSFGVSKGGIIPFPPDTTSMKEYRKQSTVAVGVASGLTGLLIGGPIVGVVAGFTGAVVTKKALKKREKKAMKKYQQELSETLSNFYGQY